MNFSGSLLLLFQNESWCENLHLKIKMIMLIWMKTVMNMEEKHILIHMNDFARRLAFTRLQPYFLGYNNNR